MCLELVNTNRPSREPLWFPNSMYDPVKITDGLQNKGGMSHLYFMQKLYRYRNRNRQWNPNYSSIKFNSVSTLAVSGKVKQGRRPTN